MSKDKKKNEYGTFKVPGFKIKSLINRKSLSVAILAIVFLGGGGAFVYNKFFKPQENKAQVKEVDSRIPGWWFQDHFGSSVCETSICDPEADIDNDKLTNYQEFYYKTDPANAHSVGDKLTDGELVAAGFDPSREGRKTFDQLIEDISSETNPEFLGESVVFGEDIQKIINETIDPTKVQLPKVNLTELNISYENTNETIKKYFEDNNAIIERYFSSSFEAKITSALEENNIVALEDLKFASSRALLDMKRLSTPSNVILLHQYYISMLQLIPLVLTIPDPGALADETNVEGNRWYDSAQALSIVLSKINIETQRLINSDR